MPAVGAGCAPQDYTIVIHTHIYTHSDRAHSFPHTRTPIHKHSQVIDDRIYALHRTPTTYTLFR